MLNFGTTPYFDDFDEAKKFLRILFRPGYAVQTRELTQLQTILQNQITRFGNHVFQEGAMVIPGQVSFDKTIGYVKLKNLNGNSQQISNFLSEFEGTVITGQTSGVKAQVIKAVPSENSDPHTLYVKYLDSGTDNASKVFSNSEEIVSDATSPRAASLLDTGATGDGSIASIQAGIYYIYGFFVLVDEQIITLDKYSTAPTYRVGLVANETIVTPDDDETLNDNAQGSFNYAAPGAHRYKISLTLTKLDVDSTFDSSFIELLRIENGEIQYKVRSTDYSVLEETLARRTYDESGNYTVRPFSIQIREHRDNNRGDWVTGRAYLVGDIVSNSGKYYVAKTTGTSGATAPTHSVGDASDGAIVWNQTDKPNYNRGVYDALDPSTPGQESKLAIGLEPGKAYVSGYEIEKYATTFIDLDKPRTYVRSSDVKTTATVGNYVLVKNVYSIPEGLTTFQAIDLYDRLTATGGTAAGTKVGTARVRGIELHSTGIYKLFLFDVKMNTGKVFEQHVKQFYYNNSTMFDFTADINPVLYQASGSITTSGTSVTGTGTKFTTELSVGDYITVGSTAYRVVSITDDVTMTLSGSPAVTGSVYYLTETVYSEPENTSLIFSLLQPYIRKIRSSDDSTVGTTYSITRNLGAKTTNGSGSFDYNLSISGETFASVADLDNYLVINNTTGAFVTPTVTLSSGSTVATFSGLAATTSYTVVAAINKSITAAKEKTKALVSAANVDFTTSATASASELLLGQADIFRIIKVKMATGFGAYSDTNSVDITERYDFDNGQRITHYDIGRLYLKPGYPAPTGTVRIIFDYFSHNTGDYFSVDSYAGSIEYEDINPYLRDAFDFRPVINSAGVFTGNGLTAMPKRGIDIEADYSYYLARKDKITIDPNGNFAVVSGVPSLNPTEPADPKIGMVLHKLTLAPYTVDTTTDNVFIETMDNKRYTMRDIGKLEKRIENVEYYTSLSMLEQETKSLSIRDEFDLERYKNGFIVDNFEGHGVGDSTSSDYRCSVDMERKELRPFFTMNNVNMLEKNTTNASRTADGYQVTGDIVTLPYTNQVMINQPYASRTENVNPFAIFTFIGTIGLNPSSDEWFEVNRRPDIVINQEGNFNTIATLAERAGVLGTVWNAWQTQWTGSSRSVTETLVYGVHSTTVDRYVDGMYAGTRNRTAGEGQLGGSWGAQGMARTITNVMTATDVGQARTGIRTNVVAKVDTQQLEDRVLSTAVIPYIRSRNVLFLARGLKPTTKFYAFFDDTPINQYITPATRISFNTVTGFGSAFDYTSNAGGGATASARRINGNVDTALNRGDVIIGQTSGATAVVAMQENRADNTKHLYVVNIIGTFQNGEEIIGSESAARGTINTAVVPSTLGGDLVSTLNGDAIGLFNIPNTDAIRFRTGTREFKLSDSEENSEISFTSRGRQSYRAQGILETKQATILATRNAELVQEVVNETRTVIQTSTRTAGDTGWWDPLAQTFLVQKTGGAFITKVDVYFATKDGSIPVQMELREVVNGYPGKNVLPFSRKVMTPDNVTVSEDATSVTSFVFDAPVYVQDATEYCIVLLSDSNNYRVWISQLGEKNVGTDRFISEQPYAGVLFKSQNASTWTADQLQDLKFTIHRAKFNTGVTGVATFINDALPIVDLELNPFQTTNGSNKIRVYQPNHGMSNGSSVQISGVASGTYNNIPSTQLNATHVIADATLDDYTITVSTNANATGVTGSSGARATTNVRYDTVQPIVSNNVFSGTSLTFTAKTVDMSYGADLTNIPLLANENTDMPNPRTIASENNEASITPAADASFTLYANMYTENDSVSPIIDTHRLSLVTVSNRIDSPSSTMNITTIDDRTVLASNSTVTIDGTLERLTTANATTQALFKTLVVGKYIVISGTSSNDGTYLLDEVAADGSYIGVVGNLTNESPTTLTLVSKENYVDEIAPINGSALSKYVTKTINLKNASTFFKVIYSYNKPQESDIKIYYKIVPVGSNVSLDSVNYTLLEPNNSLLPIVDPTAFAEADYEASGLDSFNQIRLKVVMTSSSTSKVPRIKDFRVICCA